jgi:uncharacterized protein DUF3592
MTMVLRFDRARVFVRRLRNLVAGIRRSQDYSTWRLTQAEIYSTTSGFLNRQYCVEIWYTYRALDEPWSGSCVISFPDQQSADSYSGMRPSGSKIMVRYNAAVPGESMMFEKDQSDANPEAVVMQKDWAEL